jgi:uncharacterized protein YbcI
MTNLLSTAMATQVADAAIAFQLHRTGHAPTAATVVMAGDTLVITLHGALSEAERVLSRSAEGAAKVQAFHRELFGVSADVLRREIELITGMTVREAAGEVEPVTGAVVHAFTSGTMVQVFQMVKNGSGSAADPGIGRL